jgi:glycine/D-amino acid oxidase-like deaminating enzyme
MDLRTGAAFWPIKNGLLNSYPALAGDERADVLVIGAGITGALVAERLSAAGADVVVVDRRDVGSGSTAATTGLLQYETDTSLMELAGKRGLEVAVRAYRLGLDAIDDIEQLTEDVGDPCGFSRRPSVYLASSGQDAGTLEAECALRRAHGFDVEWLTPDALRERYGLAGAAGGIGSVGNAQIDAYRFTHAMFAAAARRGTRVYDRTEVSTIHHRPDGVVAETNRGGCIEARRVVWAAGYEAVQETQRRVGQLHSTWALVSEPLADRGAWADGALLWETARPYLYARLTDDERVMVGGEDQPLGWWHQSERRLRRKRERLLERFSEWFPDLKLEVAYSWAGSFSTTSDGLPYIGETPEHPHAWLALGYGGNGITFSMIAANLIRDAWLERTNPDAQLFRFDR